MPSGSIPPESSTGSAEPAPSNPASIAPPEIKRATILEQWDITPEQLTEIVNDNPSLRGIMLGYAAEHKFRQIVERHPEVSATKKHDDHDRKRKSDRVITYRGMEFSVEVKSLQTNSIRRVDGTFRGKAQVDASDCRTVTLRNGRKLVTTLLLCGEFDILAVNCFAFENRWNFAYALNRDLPTSTARKYKPHQQKQLIASLVPVMWPPEPPFVDDVFPLVERLHRERSRQ